MLGFQSKETTIELRSFHVTEMQRSVILSKFLVGVHCWNLIVTFLKTKFINFGEFWESMSTNNKSQSFKFHNE